MADPQARPDPSAWGELRELWRARSLLAAFTRNELRVRYVGSSVGVFWLSRQTDCKREQNYCCSQIMGNAAPSLDITR